MFIDKHGLEMQNLISRNSHQIRNVLMIEEGKKAYQQKSSEEYYLASVLDEIIGYCTTLIRWQDDFKDGFDQDIEKTHVGNLIIQSLRNELSMYYRKQLEALINLTLWANNADEKYFKYYYMMKEYEELNYRIKDIKEFYGFDSVLLNKHFDLLKIEIETQSRLIDENKCFFLNQDPKYKKTINGVKLLTSMSSIKDKLKMALLSCSKVEKVLLGLTYEQYSSSSKNIHFTPENIKITSETILQEIGLMFVMINAIISKSASILNISDLEQIETIDKALMRLNSSRNWYTPILEDIYDIDDYVYTNNGVLGRVVDKCSSSYGYRSYKIHFLTSANLYVLDDFLLAHHFRRIQPKEQLLYQVYNIKPELKKMYEESNDKKRIEKTLDETMVILWNTVLRKRLIG